MKLYLTLEIIFLIIQSTFSFNWKHFSFNDSTNREVITTTQKICAIATSAKAKLNIIYSCQMAPMEQQFIGHLHNCMLTHPTFKLTVEEECIEPTRSYSSFNIFMIPDVSTSGLACAARITAMLNNAQRQKHNHKYLFVWRKANATHLQTLLEDVWQKNILHAIVLRDNDEFYTHEPFTPSGFRVKQLSSEVDDFYYDKLNNWHRARLNISMFMDSWRALPLRNTKYAGYSAVDGELSRTILQKLNATGYFIAPADKKQFGEFINNSFSGVLKDITSGHTNIGFNARFNLPKTRVYIEELYAHHRRTLYLIVPAAQKLPRYLGFINVIGPKLWYLALASFMLVFVIFVVMEYCICYVTNLERMHWLDILEHFLRVQYGVPVERFPNISSLRQVLMAWIFFCFVLNNIYMARLESTFVQPNYGAEIDTLDQVSSLNVPIFAISTLLLSIRESLPPHYFQIINATAKYLPPRLSAQHYFMPLAERSNRIAFILREDTAKDFILNSYDAERNRPMFHIVNEYLQTMPLTYIATLGSPFIEKFEMLISKLIEAGIIEHWQNMDVRRRIQTVKNGEEIEVDDGIDITINTDDRVVLTLDILQGAFYMWLICLLFSLLVFIAENVYYTIQQRRHTGEMEISMFSIEYEDD